MDGTENNAIQFIFWSGNSGFVANCELIWSKLTN